MEIIQEQQTNIFYDPSRNCADVPDVTFFPHDEIGVERAKRICKGCPVLQQCLEYALVNREEHGVWGGVSEKERRRLQKQRNFRY